MAQKQGNPAVVGLAGFGLTTLALQFHNVGWMGITPVIWLGIVFGGGAQLFAGLQEMKTGNNFGYSAFTSYGAFWISLALMLVGTTIKGADGKPLFGFAEADLGWFLVAWTLYTAIMFVGSLRVSTALATTFFLLLLGFVLLDLSIFVNPSFKQIAGYELMVCALSAWYIMAHLIYADVFGYDVLPVGGPILKGRDARTQQLSPAKGSAH